jgi:hypothetical protein
MKEFRVAHHPKKAVGLSLSSRKVVTLLKFTVEDQCCYVTHAFIRTAIMNLNYVDVRFRGLQPGWFRVLSFLTSWRFGFVAWLVLCVEINRGLQAVYMKRILHAHTRMYSMHIA